MRCATFGYRLRVPRRIVHRVAPRRPLRAVRCEESTVAPTELVKVKFTIPHHVEFGQSVCILGSTAALGDWEVEKSQCLTWSEGDIWSGVVELAPSEVEYKYFTKNPDGTPAEWQPCENLTAQIDGEEMEVTDEWNGAQKTTTTEEVLLMEPEFTPEAPEATTEMVPEPPEPLMTTEPVTAAAADDDDDFELPSPIVEEAVIPDSVQELAEEVLGEAEGKEATVQPSNNATKGTISA